MCLNSRRITALFQNDKLIVLIKTTCDTLSLSFSILIIIIMIMIMIMITGYKK